MIETNVTYVPGDDENHVYVCITSPTRPFSRHVWYRAIVHICRMLDVDFFVRDEAIHTCVDIMRVTPIDIFTQKKPPQFSWKGIPGKL